MRSARVVAGLLPAVEAIAPDTYAVVVERTSIRVRRWAPAAESAVACEYAEPVAHSGGMVVL